MGRVMIYEHTAQKRRFAIKWVGEVSDHHEGRWVACCDGAYLAHGEDPEAVLTALLAGLCLPALDGANPAAMNLPTHLDGWRIGRM